MENIKNNTQPSVEQHEKLSLEGISDNTIKLMNLSYQMLRLEREVRSTMLISRYVNNGSLIGDNIDCFDDYAKNLFASVNLLIINDILE